MVSSLTFFELLNSLHLELSNSLAIITLSDVARGTRNHWDSVPLIMNIFQGSIGMHFSEDEHIECSIQDSLASAIASESKIQKSVYEALHKSFCTSSISSTLIIRRDRYFKHEVIARFVSFDSVDFLSVFQIFSKMGNQIRISNLKLFRGMDHLAQNSK